MSSKSFKNSIVVQLESIEKHPNSLPPKLCQLWDNNLIVDVNSVYNKENREVKNNLMLYLIE